MSIALADANILVSRTLRDYVVYAAKLGAVELHWSETILDEVTRNLIDKFGFTLEDALTLVERLEAYLPHALVEVKHADHRRVAAVEMDDQDRHVVAAALSAGADILLTDNLSHFPQDWLANHGIELLDSTMFVQRLATDHPAILRRAHHLGVASRPQTSDQVLDILGRVTDTSTTSLVRAVLSTEPDQPDGQHRVESAQPPVPRGKRDGS